jgi:DNA-binding NarL/FixJ family response regulator
MNCHAPRRSNILVMHPDPLLCAGLVAALSGHDRFEVRIGDGSGEPGAHPVDVVIADYPEALRLAGAPPPALPAARILALTGNDREADIRRAIEAGVHGYLLLGGPIDELVEGVTAVAGGVRFVCRAVARRMADSLTRASLTLREVEVLRLVATGESNKAIARELCIEVGTVKSHMSAIMTKLGAISRTQAAGIAISRGLVDEHARSGLALLPFSGARMALSQAPRGGFSGALA